MRALHDAGAEHIFRTCTATKNEHSPHLANGPNNSECRLPRRPSEEVQPRATVSCAKANRDAFMQAGRKINNYNMTMIYLLSRSICWYTVLISDELKA